jgi:hypothetical protein
MDLEYFYPAANDGRISKVMDHITGEEVNYQYDALNRLIQALTADPPAGQDWGEQWGMNFTYDGFGNLAQQTAIKGTGVLSMNLAISPATNRITSTGYQYDANGNLTNLPDGTAYSFDVADRVSSAGAVYNPWNQRVWVSGYAATNYTAPSTVQPNGAIALPTTFAYSSGFAPLSTTGHSCRVSSGSVPSVPAHRDACPVFR